MAKFWNEMKMTSQETKVVNAAWLTLDTLADHAGSTGQQYLRDALRMETTGSHSVPTLAAKALLCEWFARATAGALMRDSFGTRPASILVRLLAAELKHRDKVTEDENNAMLEAGRVKDAALSRMREQAYADAN